jgi:hypothetical protein
MADTRPFYERPNRNHPDWLHHNLQQAELQRSRTVVPGQGGFAQPLTRVGERVGADRTSPVAPPSGDDRASGRS